MAKDWRRKGRRGFQPIQLGKPFQRRAKPSPYKRCAQRGCRLLTAYRRCSAHAKAQPRINISGRVLS